MKAIGIIRRIDSLGRLVIPKELRRQYKMEEDAPIQFFVEDDKVILQKYTPGCIFCGSTKK